MQLHWIKKILMLTLCSLYAAETNTMLRSRKTTIRMLSKRPTAFLQKRALHNKSSSEVAAKKIAQATCSECNHAYERGVREGVIKTSFKAVCGTAAVITLGVASFPVWYPAVLWVGYAGFLSFPEKSASYLDKPQKTPLEPKTGTIDPQEIVEIDADDISTYR